MVEDRYIYGKLSQMDESITVRWDIEKYGSQEVFGIRMDINDPDISETDLDELQLYVEIEDYLTKIVEKVVETLRIDEEGFDDAADFIEENVDSYACYINGEEYEL
jgi:serine kinase of HPr protein (carbohydrate metabolism regulator)